MNTRILVLLLGFALLFGSCASPTPTPAPQVTSPAVDAGSRTVTFQTEDGITLSGTLFGASGVGVLLSHMFPADQSSWHAFGRTLADNGYLALAYDFRGYGESGGSKELAKLDRDVRAAVAFLREQGARQIVLIGASMGGTASAKVALSVEAIGLVVLSSPQSFQGLNVTADELNLNGASSLWIASRDDPVSRDVEVMYEDASEPKSIHLYNGAAHGTDIFSTPDGADLSRRILNFIADLVQ